MKNPVGAPTVVLTIAAFAVAASVTLPEALGAGSGDSEQSQLASQRRPQDSVVSFLFEQLNGTNDQVTIVFSNTQIDIKRPPRPVFGEDIVQEFSFSGRDFPSGRVAFNRRVRDKSFLESRYIRVINHGSNSWGATTITMTVDGKKFLDNVSMYPRRGVNTKGGIERWNRTEWNPVFWEGNLQNFRPRSQD
jgi:hypothetical protein